LTQAEAVVDVINAKTGTALKIANRQLAGGLTEKILVIREALLGVHALLEIAIDFSDDIQDENQRESVLDQLDGMVIQRIEQLIRVYEQDHFYRDGVKMAVIGRPNVGKSSLMNRLIQRDRAIVTAVPGTTRDVIEETLHIKGLPVIIMDTAGLHEAQGEVEKIGIRKTRQSITDADIVLFLVDNSEPLQPQDKAIYREIQDKKHLVVRNKNDLPTEKSGSAFFENVPPDLCLKVSALTGAHIQELKDMIWKMIVGEAGIDREVGIVPNMRHKNGLEKCLFFCQQARLAIKEAMPDEVIATDVKEAISRLDDLLGDQYQPDVLDQIFSRFCIGK